MVTKKIPTCFVAMAFGHHDTDLFYMFQILPVLKKNKIKAIIINRRQSNDDINIQIIEQIKLADLCVVDLTYARPSVYFEAGFAQQRDIPVIYTARSDHLNLGQPDNLRIHFDLSMKPIITWNDVDDKTFSMRLEKRIKSTFLNNWNKKQQSTKKYDDAESVFLKLPTYERMEYICRDTINHLRRKGFSYWNVYKSFGDFNIGGQPPKRLIYKGGYNHFFGHKIVDKQMYFVSVHVYTSPSKKELLEFERRLTNGFVLSRFSRDLIEKKKIKKITLACIVLSLDKVTSNRIENTLQSIVVSEGSVYEDLLGKGAWIYYSQKVDCENIYYAFLTGIKSRLQLSDKLAPVIKTLFSKPKKKISRENRIY